MNWSKTIKKYREKAIITQAELAKKLGVGVNNISRWERGHFEPTIETKRKLKALFDEAGIEGEE